MHLASMHLCISAPMGYGHEGIWRVVACAGHGVGGQGGEASHGARQRCACVCASPCCALAHLVLSISLSLSLSLSLTHTHTHTLSLSLSPEDDFVTVEKVLEKHEPSSVSLGSPSLVHTHTDMRPRVCRRTATRKSRRTNQHACFRDTQQNTQVVWF